MTSTPSAHTRRIIALSLLAALGLSACGEADAPEQPGPAAVVPGAPEGKEEAAQLTHEGKADFSFDICKVRGWYDDGVCDWFCPRHDDDCDPDPLFADARGSRLRYPIVLNHGFNAGREGMWSFNGVEAHLERSGNTVLVAEVAPFADVPTRAAQLAAQIDALLASTGAKKVNLVSHSMGGLDARYLISALGYGDRVASLTTISSPHRGSEVADALLKLLPGKSGDLVDSVATMWGRTYNEVEQSADVRAALRALSTPSMRAFNEAHRDDARVEYLSWAGVSSVFGIYNPKDPGACDGLLFAHPRQADVMNAQLVPGAKLIAGSSFTPNDGMVKVTSAKWGAFLGCIPADHLDEVGQVRKSGVDRHSGFDHLRFYDHITDTLATRGH